MANLSVLKDLTSLACRFIYLGHVNSFSFGNIPNYFFQKAVKRKS